MLTCSLVTSLAITKTALAPSLKLEQYPTLKLILFGEIKLTASNSEHAIFLTSRHPIMPPIFYSAFLCLGCSRVIYDSWWTYWNNLLTFMFVATIQFKTDLHGDYLFFCCLVNNCLQSLHLCLQYNTCLRLSNKKIRPAMVICWLLHGIITYYYLSHFWNASWRKGALSI